GLSEGEFRARFRNTPLWRPRRRGILRNAAIILGNQRHVPALKALCRALQDEEELIRGAAAWALGQLGGEQARAALRARLPQESATQVRTEIERALEAASAEIAE
ncbi:MAG: HEAT repeat domain-containing protein, partial [Planctomycetota bacterium]